MVTDRHLIDAINKRLLQEYRVLDGRPIYRIVWSLDQIEIRKGKTSDWYGEIFIREYTSVRPVKKYWYLSHPCWVLEKLVFIPNASALKEIREELVEAGNGTYESMLTFYNEAKKLPLPVSWEVVDAVLYSLHNPQKVDYDKLEAIQEKQEYDGFYDQLSQGERSPLFVWENSAFVSTRQLEYKRQATQTEAFDPNKIVAPKPDGLKLVTL